MLEAIIFDLYETLVTHFDPHWKPRPSTAERLGIDQRAFAAAWRASQRGRFTGEYPDFPSVLRHIGEELGEKLDEAVVQQLQDERLATQERPLLHVEAEIIDVLRELQSAGVKVGLISNCEPGDVAAWDRSPLAAFIDDPVFSSRVGHVKPDREIYDLACHALDVDPGRVAFVGDCGGVGDGGGNELSGAAEAGLHPYWASWFIDRWPEWRRDEDVYERARAWPRLTSPREVVALVQGATSSTRDA